MINKNLEEEFTSDIDAILYSIQKIGSIGYWEYIYETQIYYLSPEAIQFFDKKYDYRIHKIKDISDLIRYVHPKDRKKPRQFFESLSTSNKYSSYEFRLINFSDDSIRYFQIKGKIVNADNTNKKAVGTMLDITDQKKIEIELKKKNLQQQVLNDISRKVFTIDEKNLFKHIVKVTAETLDIELTGILKYDEINNEFKVLERFVQGEVVVEMNIVPADSSTISGLSFELDVPILINDLDTDERFSGAEDLIQLKVKSGISVLIKNNFGKWGSLSTFSTKKWKFTQDDVAFIQSLANIVAGYIERKIIQEDLLRVKRFESIARLVSGISHDFNNYLGILFGYNELLMDNLVIKKDKENLHLLGKIYSTLERSNDLVKQIQTLSTNQTVIYEPIDLNSIINNSFDIFSEKFTRKDFSIVLNLADNLALINGNQTQVQQILLNFLTNSYEAIELKDTQISTISLTTKNVTYNDVKNHFPNIIENTSEDYVLFCVKDNGSGIPESIISSIFEPFFSSKSYIQHKNVGMGLSIVYGIVKQMNGQIIVESELGEGTKFELVFPSLIGTQFNKKIRKDYASTILDGKNRKLLLVEDNESLLGILTIFLEKQNFQVLPANNGNSALELFSLNPDIFFIISDVILPQMNGNDLVKELRSKFNMKLKVLFISGYTKDLLKEIRINEETSFLEKPFNFLTLKEAILKLIND